MNHFANHVGFPEEQMVEWGILGVSWRGPRCFSKSQKWLHYFFQTINKPKGGGEKKAHIYLHYI